ncbi:TetR/AcrR family transcriptional regulator [Nocardioides sp. CPCC 205120]|uniref:TetR/AcrR family transcriptional regulator n=1 Tax=Nocardioides sp. CPCC 205120 TaxID=3406462 RepID=UPI003B50234E
MPRTADHDQRRRSIAAAFQALLAEGGLGSTTYPRLAARAGISVGLIQHYFASKEELLRFAYADCLARRDTRIAALVDAGEAAGRPVSAMLTDSLLELVPLDDERRTEHAVVQSLLTGALHDPALADVARAASRETHHRVRVAVENAKRCGEVEPAVDAAATATVLLATTRGIATGVALGEPGTPPGTAADAAAALAPVVALSFTGRCRHHDRPAD